MATNTANRWPRGGLVLLVLIGALLIGAWLARWFSDAQTVHPAAGIRTTGWEDLVPRDWDPIKQFRARHLQRLSEGDPGELAQMRTMRKLWDNAPTRSELNGARIRLPGYVVPIEQARGEVSEFLLVPYFGACIHSPPPPANQIVHVVLHQPRTLRTMDAVWVSGTLSTRRQDSPWGMSGYTLAGIDVAPHVPAGR